MVRAKNLSFKQFRQVILTRWALLLYSPLGFFFLHSSLRGYQ